MRLRKGACWLTIGMLLLGQVSARGGDWPSWKKAKPGEPNTLEDVARSIDCLEDKILDDGTVVLKKPDVYGQSRMTLYRKDFEKQMYGAIGKFNAVVSARLFRSDQAALSSQTSLAAGLATANSNAKTTTSTTTNVVAPSLIPAGSSGGITPDGLAPNSIVRPSTIAGELGTSPFSFGGTAPGSVGLEPTVYLDELKDYQDHLNQIRRTNMGDDIADSAGYGLYLLRMPVSIQPGECTRKGHGAVLTATIRHHFGPTFLRDTFRNLVINDLTDQLSPIVYEMIRSNALKNLNDIKDAFNADFRYMRIIETNPQDTSRDLYAVFQADPGDGQSTTTQGTIPAQPSTSSYRPEDKNNLTNQFSGLLQMNTIYGTLTRGNDRSFPIPGTEFDNVFILQNLVILALTANDASRTASPRPTDIRSLLRRETEAAYDIISQIYGNNDPNSAEIVAAFEAAVENIGLHIRTRNYEALEDDYRNIARALPGELKYVPGIVKGKNEKSFVSRDANNTLTDPLTILCYAIAVEAGLLDQQLRVDMKRVFGKDGGDCSEIDAMRFYRPQPDPDAVAKFEEYIRRRWPLITFALYPQVDQQNIDDVNSTSRDLQIALAFAFSSGQINFQQLLQFQRKVITDAEALALNRTVTSFSHGDDTFGYRFTPRYQNAPPEKSNFAVIANTLIKGGQGRDYRLKNSQLEAGQRELNAVVIMPSFLQGIQMDVTGNWFPLHDPDQMVTPTPRMIEQGRKVVELREALNCIHDHKTYRKGDVQRLTTRVHQLEAMLPMQTQEIPLPYENTLGGFQLFQQGTTALVPQLDAFEGVDTIEDGMDVDLILYGKHFSIQETYIVVGGKYLPLPSLDAATAAGAAGGTTTTASTTTTTTTTTTGSPAASSGTPGSGSGTPAAGAGMPATATATMALANPGAAVASTTSAMSPASAASTPTTPTTPAQTTPTPTTPTPATPPATTPAPTTPTPPAMAAASSPATIDVVSRNVMHVHIPKGLLATSVLDADVNTKPRDYVELYVATPNGISNRLLIPFHKTAAIAPPHIPTKGNESSGATTPANGEVGQKQGTQSSTNSEVPHVVKGHPPKSNAPSGLAPGDPSSTSKPDSTAPPPNIPPTQNPGPFDSVQGVQPPSSQGVNPAVDLNPKVTPLPNPDVPAPVKSSQPHIPNPNPAVDPKQKADPSPKTPPPAENPDPNPGQRKIRADSKIHIISPDTGLEVRAARQPSTPNAPGSLSSRAPRAVPARDADLKPSAYRPTSKGVGDLPPLPSSAPRPTPAKPASSPKAATKPASRDLARPATAAATPTATKADSTGKDGDSGWRWPWKRQEN